MIHIWGYPIPLPPGWEFLDNTYGTFIATLAAWVLVALAWYLIVAYPLRLIARRMTGDVEDIFLDIIRKPIMIIVLAWGLNSSLSLLPILPVVLQFVERVATTIILVVVVYMLWRVVKDVLVYYGNRWAKTTESNLDDNLIPALNLFGPLVILINGALLILPIWGIDISSVLVGAGVVGLVLGLALQEPLSNVFSGLSLLIEAPFRQGDLIQFSGDRVGMVERLGLRSTQIYAIDEHSTVFMPNKALSSSMVLNLSKPTVEQKNSIVVSIDPKDDMARVQEELKEIAIAHPNVVAENLGVKVTKLRAHVTMLQQQANTLKPGDENQRALTEQAARYEQAITKLDLEHRLNQQLLAFHDSLFDLLLAIRTFAPGGWSSKERKEFRTKHVTPTAALFKKTMECAEAWSQAPDPWITDREQRQLRKLWDDRNLRLKVRWNALEQILARPRGRAELRLDDNTVRLLDWLKTDYKIVPEEWKDPYVTFKEFDGTQTKLVLWFYVDNVRLEHFERPHRVVTEIARQIREHLGNRAVAPEA